MDCSGPQIFFRVIKVNTYTQLRSMKLFKYAMTAALIIWFKRRARRVTALLILVTLFFFLGYFFDELRAVYPRKDYDELMSLYWVKLFIQMIIMVIFLYLFIGLFRLNAQDISDIEDLKKNAMSNRKPLVIETRMERLIKQKQEQKHEQNY